MRWLALLLYVITQFGAHYVIAQANEYSITADSVELNQLPVPVAKRLIKAGVGLPIYRASSVSPVFMSVALEVTLEQKLTNVNSGLDVNGFDVDTRLCVIKMIAH